jgi:hypothetical protein
MATVTKLKVKTGQNKNNKKLLTTFTHWQINSKWNSKKNELTNHQHVLSFAIVCTTKVAMVLCA